MTFVPPQVLEPVKGTQIGFSDWNQLLNFVLQTTGYCTAFQQGAASALPLLQPLAVTTNGTMTVSIGGTTGTPQFVLCTGLLCGSGTATPYVVPNNTSGITRTDTIWMQADLVTVLILTKSIEDDTGVKAPGPVPVVISGIATFYQAGGSPGPTGSGWVAFATIAVPNGASGITSGEVTVQIPLMNPKGDKGDQGIPGTPGTDGTDGIDGLNGTNGHGTTTTTSNTSVPAPGSTTAVAVVDGTAFPNGTFAILSDGTNAIAGEVTGGGTTNSLTFTNLGQIAGGSTINAGATLTFSGPVIPSQSTIAVPAVIASPPTAAINISLTIPNVGSLWYFEFVYYVNASDTDGTLTRTAGSVANDTGNSGTPIGAQNPYQLYAGTVAPGQTLTVQGANFSSGGPHPAVAAAFLTAKAWRIS